MFNYINHIIYDNKYYQRQFENDLPKTNLGMETAKRIALIALPFISLYGPAGKGISIAMGSTRCVSHLLEGGMAIYRKDMWAFSGHMVQVALAATAVAATIFSFQVGLLITTIADIGTSLTTVTKHLVQGEYEKGLAEMLQAASSMLYLSMMLTGSLELTLASVLLQGAISLYQALDEWKEGRWPEFFAKLTMGMLRFNQALQYVDQIKQRDAFLALDKYVRLMQQVKKGREVSHLINSPLQTPGEEVIMVDADGNPFNFGENVNGYGKGIIKGMNLQFRTTVIDGKNMKEIDFKVNHVFRDKIQIIVDGMKDFTPSEMKSFLELTQSHAHGIKIEQVPFELCVETKRTIGNAYQITFDGLGKVLIGASKDMPNMYDRVRFVVDPDKSAYDVHEMMSFLNLDDAFKTSSEDDIERLKIGQLYRIFYPKEATLLERRNEYFELPIEKLKDKIISDNPQMQSILEKMLPTMTSEEILPGRLRYVVPEISKMIYAQGGRALISTITGTHHSPEEGYKRFASILKMGMLSSDVRYRNGMQVGGLSPSMDFYTGGADSIFTQFLTKQEFAQKMDLDKLYHGEIRILISLDVLNTGTYQYNFDGYGTREVNNLSPSNTYLNRPNIFQFTQNETQYFHTGNEVMIKERLDPSYIIGVIVPSASMRDGLLNTLRSQGLVSSTNGVETIMNIPVNKFIRIADRLSNSLLT
jgi:hypothetical protein